MPMIFIRVFLRMDSCAGVYHNPAFGRMEWTLTDGLLHVTMGVGRGTQ